MKRKNQYLRIVYKMRILVDADACPVKAIIEDEAKKRNIEVIMFVDTSHIIKSDYSLVVTVDKAADSVDIALANRLSKGDIVVTQDYGVAAMALGKGAYAINQNGLVYSNENIDMLLFERHIGKKMRKNGQRTGTIKKRNNNDDIKFRNEFITLIQNMTN